MSFAPAAVIASALVRNPSCKQIDSDILKSTSSTANARSAAPVPIAAQPVR